MPKDQLTETIRKRAYQIWETMGRPEGRDREHWLQAEMECRTIGAEVKPAAPGSTTAKPQPKGVKEPRPKQAPKPLQG